MWTKSSRAVRCAAMILAVFSAGACSDADPVAPPAAEPAPAEIPAEALLFSAGEEPLLEMISWNTPRASASSASRRIGILGGTVSAGGVTVVIPPLALRRTTQITVTVPEGRWVMADLQPHGLNFRVPPVLLFPLLGTDAGLSLNGLVGVYTDEEPVDGLIKVSEQYPVRILGLSLGFLINHFSRFAPARGGYVLVGG